MGSATAAHLALRGKRVLGLERWVPGHHNGSSHGDSRIIREMYFEHSMYVPLLQRAYELWGDLGRRVGKKLLNINGGLMIGRREGMLVTGTLRSAQEHDLLYEVLSASEVKKRYPAFDLEEDLVAVLDPRAGWLDPEACNAAHLMTASRHGADLRFEEPLLAWNADEDGVSVRTGFGEYYTDHLVLSTGARTRKVLSDLELPLEIERQVLFWMKPPDVNRYGKSVFPIWAYEYKPGHISYGFPTLDSGVKASVMHSGEIFADADSVDRTVKPDEIDALRNAVRPVLPDLARAEVRSSDTCLFTNTPDHDFIIDFHPRHPRVLVSSACSGHGFKFASVVGEVQADLVVEGKSKFDLTPFRIARPALGNG